MADESVDLVVTDPPWGINFQESSQWTTKWVMSYDDSPDIQAVITELVPQLFRVMKPGAHFYIFYAIQDTGWWTDTLGSAGFYIRNRPLIWFKGQPSMSDVYTSFLPCYESILWGWKPGVNGFRRYFTRSIPEAFLYPRTDNQWHENQKPTDLLGRFIEASSDVNDLVFDPFAGGGSTPASAFELGRYFLGIEKDEVNYGKAARRLSELEK
jgi:site-specific DNA-methyltransferase (adenine-specific)